MAESSVTGHESEAFNDIVAKGGELLQLDKIEEARMCFLAALDKQPESEQVLGLLGLTHFRLSCYEDADTVYKKLVTKSPNDASYRLNLGLVHLKLGRPLEAIAELSKSRDLDPSQTRTVSYLGLAHARNGEYAQAFEEFLRADEGDLASEMEQFLEPKQVSDIRDRVTPRAEAPPMFPSGGADDDISEAIESGIAEALDSRKPRAPTAEIEIDIDLDDATEASVDSPVEAVPSVIVEDRGLVTQAVQVVQPSTIAAAKAAANTFGHVAPQPLSELATGRLLRPSETGAALEIGAGGVLIARVDGRLNSRTHGVMVSSGELGFEPATRRIRGTQTEEIFGVGDAKLYAVTGQGYMIVSACGEVFTSVCLDDDILYLREQYIFAFEPDLSWENGRIPGTEFLVAQFRGSGCVALRTPKELLSVKLSSDRVMYVESDVLAGWIGRVVPRLVKPAAGGRASTPFVECSGEGVVLIHDLQGNA